jgi:hypothetical protein
MNYKDACKIKLECDGLINEYRFICEKIKDNERLLHELDITQPEDFKPHELFQPFLTKNSYINVHLSDYIDFKAVHKNELKELVEEHEKLMIRKENSKNILLSEYGYIVE